MSEESFNGERLTVTKTEFVLVLALTAVVGSMFWSIDAFVILGVILAALGVAGVAWLASGKPVKQSND